MKHLLKLEEAALLAFGIYLFSLTDYRWYWFPALILLPDLSMLGYLAGNKTGAWSYNLFHHRLFAMVFLVAGVVLMSEPLLLVGTILFSHIAMDRMFGYGLKYEKGFRFTHLGEIGKAGKG